MKTYTLTEIAELLDVDTKTLRRWVELEKFDLTNQTSKYDKRIKWLSEEQVSQLAKAHERLWPPRPKSPQQAQAQATGINGAVNTLREHVDTLREDHIGIVQFTSTIKLLQDRIEKLEKENRDMLLKQTDLLLAIHELQSKPKAGRKPKTAAGESDQGD